MDVTEQHGLCRSQGHHFKANPHMFGNVTLPPIFPAIYLKYYMEQFKVDGAYHFKSIIHACSVLWFWLHSLFALCAFKVSCNYHSLFFNKQIITIIKKHLINNIASDLHQYGYCSDHTIFTSYSSFIINPLTQLFPGGVPDPCHLTLDYDSYLPDLDTPVGKTMYPSVDEWLTTMKYGSSLRTMQYTHLCVLLLISPVTMSHDDLTWEEKYNIIGNPGIIFQHTYIQYLDSNHRGCVWALLPPKSEL